LYHNRKFFVHSIFSILKKSNFPAGIFYLKFQSDFKKEDMLRMYKPGIFFITLFLLYQLVPVKVVAWSDHSLMTHAALKNHPLFANSTAVEVKSLENFLKEVEYKLPAFLKTQEQWSIENLTNYKPCPEELLFKATGNPDDILARFFSAIRINPNSKLALYRQILPGESIAEKRNIQLTEITTLKDTLPLASFSFIRLSEGEFINPFSVLCAASEEPDLGLDLGLFEDNKTNYGAKYGFGKQPFGNPNLEYSSQAPFHMGFFHEAKILYKFGPFLKETYIDYRIFLYKALSEFAFKNNQPYWGWRFLGWGMHYIGDVSMPYHMKPLPGVSTVKMLWINLKSVAGAPAAKNRALQLVSNRHAVLEEFQSKVLRTAISGNQVNPLITALQKPVTAVPFNLENLKDYYTKNSADGSGEVDKILEQNMPVRLVLDPTVEAVNQTEILQIVEAVRQARGNDAVDKITGSIAERMSIFSMYVRCYLEASISISK
jgi:hypothetical protein